MSRVFISHSSDDKPIGEKICRFLETNGIRCWIAPRDVTPGKNYGAAILDAIDECCVFVLILSAHSNKSGQVVREVERAASTDSIIIPFRIENVPPSRDLEFYVSAAHWLDATSRPLEKHLRELLKAINDWQQSARARAVAPSPTPVPAAPLPSPVFSGRRPAIWIVAAAVLLLLLAVGCFIFAVRSRPAKQTALAPSPSATQTTSSPLPARAEPETPPVAESISPSAENPVVQEVMASSQHDNHAGNLVFDGDPTTSWVTDTDGVGQSLSVRFKSPATITSISVLNGNARDLEHYQANNRVRTLRIKWGDGSSQIITLEDKMKMQRFPLQHRVATDSLKFEILSTYLGARNNWAAISEIAFNREASDFPETPQDRQSQPRQPIAPAVASTFPSPSIAPLPSAPVIREVVASSELTLDGQTRQGNFAFDGNPSTVWVTKGDGVGQSISVYFKSPATISSVSILNSAATEEARYRTMSHAQTIRMELSDGSVQTLTFEDKMGWQHFDLPQPKVADWVKFEIVTIFHGTKFKTVPIAEIVFNRDVLDNVPASPEQKQSSAPHPRRSPKPAPGY